MNNGNGRHTPHPPASAPMPVLHAETITPSGRLPSHTPAPASAASPGAIGPSKRLAAIDVGTNSIRLIVVDACADGTYRVIDDEKAITRLGRGFSQDGLLHDEPMESSVLAIARMKAIADGYVVERLRCVGTCAVREATNADRFVETVRNRAGVTIEPISAEEEARLAHASVAEAFDLSDVAAATVDVGGGSTEIVLCSRGAVEHVYTLPLGAVRLTERYGECDAPDPRGFDKMTRRVRKTLKEMVEAPPFTPQIMYGTGGTFTALASVCMQRGSARDGTEVLPFTVRGYEMTRADVKHVRDWLRELPTRSRGRAPGLSPDRAEIIIPGLTIVESVMKRLGVNTLRVHDRGIRDGLILQMIREAFGPASLESAARARRGVGAASEDHPHPAQSTQTEARDRLRGVRHFAHLCRYEEPHSRHVTALALSIFDQLSAQTKPERAETDWRQPKFRELLEAAGLLHDIGYVINYAKHHKHSYHLIVHADLPGFTSREVEIIANVARYHRRALPSRVKHPAFAVLPKPERQLVRRLAAILRLADGLDRNHTQSVAGVALTVEKNAAVMRIESTGDIGLDLWAAQGKGELFKKAFDLEPRFEWANAPASAAALIDDATHSAPARKRRHRPRKPISQG
ncbi:MAG: HD domain-containing protein [Phycisphaerales bacterium]